MIPWFKSLLFDRNAFTGIVRSLFMAVGAAAATGHLDRLVPWLPEWGGVALMAVSSLIRSSSPIPMRSGGK